MPAPPPAAVSQLDRDEARSASLTLARLVASGAVRDADGLAAARTLADRVAPATLARCAVYGRTVAGTREAPALLFALLERADPALADAVFERVIDDGPTLRAWLRLVRGGAAGRRSLGSAGKRRTRRWLAARSEEALLRASVGNDPSLADIVRLVHPRPRTPRRRAFYGWLLRRPHHAADLPACVRALNAFRADPSRTPPQVPLRLLTSASPSAEAWDEVARRASWQELRRNLNAFARRGLLRDASLVATLAQALSDPARVQASRVFPHQVIAARAALVPEIPEALVAALDVALELSLASLPPLVGGVVVWIERSDAMQAPLTGTGATTRADLAEAIAAVLGRRNPGAAILRADPARLLTEPQRDADLILVLSARGVTRADLRRWDAVRAGGHARLAWLGLGPSDAPPPARPDVLDLAGFSDGAFALLSRFAAGLLGTDPWRGELERIDLPVT